MTTERFTADNTEGYDAAQLAEMNRLYRLAAIAVEAVGQELGADETYRKSVLDHIAERIQRDYDAENS